MQKEIVLSVAELKEALPGLTKVTGRGRSLPVLQSVRITRNQEGVVSLQSTDLESFVTYRARAIQEGGPMDVLIPAAQLAKTVKSSSPRESIGILVQDSGDKVTLRYNIAGNKVEQTISVPTVQEWPQVPVIREPGVQLEPAFGQALKEALECSATDSSRPVINGVCLDVEDSKLHYVVATDGRSLFSANSFSFALQKSVIIPDSKFLAWSDFMDEEPCYLSVEPAREVAEAKSGTPPEAGWIRLETSRWTYVAREIVGKFPNWKQCVPASSRQGTQVTLNEEALEQLLQVLPNLPGSNIASRPIRISVDKQMVVEGRGEEDQQWTSVPIQAASVSGPQTAVSLNRDYVLRALRFGLNHLEIEDALAPVVFSKPGKKMVVMPIRMEGPSRKAPNTNQQDQQQPPTESEGGQEERKAMSVASKPTSEQTVAGAKNSGSVVESLVEHVETIKDSLKSVIRDLNLVIDTVKRAEKEKRTTEREIEIIRAKLRQIQSVSI